MSVLKYILALVCLLNGYAGFTQNDSAFVLTRSIPGEYTDFDVDNLGNIYLLSTDNRLKKLNAAGDSLAVYNEVRRYGKMAFLDVTNPLKIILYYQEFGTIVMVDRFLNILNTIDLRKQNIFQAKAVALAYDNNIWVFDELEAKLKRISDDGSLVSQTTDIRQFVDQVPDPSSIIDQSGLVYLFDETKGIYIFDHYGAFQRQIQIAGLRDFTVIDKNLLARNDRYFFRYEAGNLNVQQRPIPAAYMPAIKISIMPNAVYVLKQKSLDIYMPNK